VLQAGTGEAGRAMLQAGHHLAVSGTSMIGWAISRRQARTALDVGQDAVHFSNPYLPDTRSELALPMISGSQVIGALTVQSEKPAAFDEEDILVLQSVADSLAIMIQNARLFEQSEASLREVRSLHQRYLGEAWSQAIALQGNLTYAFENPTSDSPAEGQIIKLEKPITIRDQVIGSLTLESDQPTWQPEDEAFVDAVISQAAVALENIRLMEDSQQTSHHDRILAELSSQAWSTSDVDQILKNTLRQLVQSLQASHGTIMLETPTSRQDA
jgi:GAF domain-containing protein